MEVSKFALNAVPNVELVSFWIIIFSICFGKRMLYALPVFILIEGVIFGFGLWWFMYLYAWPILCVVALILRRHKSIWLWSSVSGAFGLIFGLLCSITYVFIGTFDGDILGGLKYAFSWWIAGLPWDAVHGVSNFIIMFVLYYPITKAISRLTQKVL